MILHRPSRHAVVLAGTAALASAGALGVWALRRFDPNAADSAFLPCLFLQFTGLLCPGCGTTRALHALVHGDVAGVVAMNPLLPVLALLLPPMLLHSLGRRVPLPKPVMDVLLGGRFWLLLIGGYWVLRNLPWWPFAWLAPG
ncbi:MAG: DUF2752 domain-containing protein [Proteobacteria bacterium]|nr:DUF2752 domain-containing protein [Pseudomonadota bacterium]